MLLIRMCHVARLASGNAHFELILLGDFGNTASADGLAAFADGETKTFLHGDRGDQLDVHGDMVARHDHLNAFQPAAINGGGLMPGF